MNQVKLSKTIVLDIIVDGKILDESGEAIEGAEVTLGDITITTDVKGYYQIVGLIAGTYTLTVIKEGFVFQESQVTLDENNPFVTLNLTSVAGGSITGHNLVVVGKQTCEVNSIALMEAGGQFVHQFGANITDKDKGIRISIADFDLDDSSDIAVSENGKGNSVFLFNGQGKKLFTIVKPDGDEKGLNAVFGDIDGDGTPEIIVANQYKDTRVSLHKADGTAIRAITVFDKKTEFNIAAGDVNGDGADEIIVVLAKKAKKDESNVFVFDGEGELLGEFTALLDEKGKDARGMVVALGDVDGDGSDEIALAQAEKDKEYIVGIYKFDGTVLKVFDVFKKGEDIVIDDGDDNRRDSKKRKCDYKGNGVVLAVGDVNADGSAEIIVSKAGGSEVRIYTFSGNNLESQLIERFVAASGDSVITSLGFATNLSLDLSVVVELPAGPTLENITIVGTSQKPIRIKDRVIKGTVRISYSVIDSMEIDVGARVVFGPGVKFAKRDVIPVGIDLTPIFPIVRADSAAANLELSFKVPLRVILKSNLEKICGMRCVRLK